MVNHPNDLQSGLVQDACRPGEAEWERLRRESEEGRPSRLITNGIDAESLRRAGAGYVAVLESEPLSPRSMQKLLHEQLNPFASPSHKRPTASLLWMPAITTALMVIHCVVFYSYIDDHGAVSVEVSPDPVVR